MTDQRWAYQVTWFNMATGETSTQPPDTDEIAKQYIPQIPAVQGIYQVHRSMGKSITEAMIEALGAYIKAADR